MHSMKFNKINHSQEQSKSFGWSIKSCILLPVFIRQDFSIFRSAVAELVKHHYQPMNDEATHFPLYITLTLEQEENIYSF